MHQAYIVGVTVSVQLCTRLVLLVLLFPCSCASVTQLSCELKMIVGVTVSLQLCKRYPGFMRVALQDPQPERRFFRRGWATFAKNVNIKDICWNLNNIRVSAETVSLLLMFGLVHVEH